MELKKYVEKYLNDERVIYHKVLHGGISRALNAGISLVTAEYIARTLMMNGCRGTWTFFLMN